MVEIPDPVVGILLSNTLERELPASAAATLALVLAKGPVTVTSKALSVMPAPVRTRTFQGCSAGKMTPLLQTGCDGKKALFRLLLLASILFFVSASRHLGGSVIREH